MVCWRREATSPARFASRYYPTWDSWRRVQTIRSSEEVDHVVRQFLDGPLARTVQGNAATDASNLGNHARMISAPAQGIDPSRSECGQRKKLRLFYGRAQPHECAQRSGRG